MAVEIIKDIPEGMPDDQRIYMQSLELLEINREELFEAAEYFWEEPSLGSHEAWASASDNWRVSMGECLNAVLCLENWDDTAAASSIAMTLWVEDLRLVDFFGDITSNNSFIPSTQSLNELTDSLIEAAKRGKLADKVCQLVLQFDYEFDLFEAVVIKNNVQEVANKSRSLIRPLIVDVLQGLGRREHFRSRGKYN